MANSFSDNQRVKILKGVDTGKLGTITSLNVTVDGGSSKRYDFDSLELFAPPPPPPPPPPVDPPPPPPPVTDGKLLYDLGPQAVRDLGRAAVWKDRHTVADDRVQIVEKNGSLSFKFTILPGDELVGARAEYGTDTTGTAKRLANNSDYWMGYSYLLPQGFDLNNWVVPMQMKDHPSQNGPMAGVILDRAKMHVDGNVTPQHPVPSGKVIWGKLGAGAPALETWHNLVIHLKTSLDPNKGLFEVYYSTGENKPVLVPGTSGPRQTWTPGVTALAHRLGLYMGAKNVPQSIHHRHFQVGTGFGAVSPVKG